MEYLPAVCKLEREIKSLVLEPTCKRDFDISVEVLSQVIIENSKDVPTLVYYMILSSDHELRHTLEDDAVVGYLLMNARILPLSWVAKVLVELKCQQYILDVIRFGPVGISIPLLTTLVEEGVEILKIAQATMVKIAYLLSTKSEALPSIESFFLKSFNQLVSSTMDNLSSESTQYNKLEEGGRLLYELLEILENAICLAYDECLVDSDKIAFYKLGNEYTSSHLGNEPEFVTIDALINFIIQKVELNLCLISCDIWILWQDYCFGSSTLQSAIGNLIFKIYSKVKEHGVNISSMLEQCFRHLQIKPKTEDDELSRANLEAIVAKVEAGDSPMVQKWYSALVEREDAWTNSKTLCLIMSNWKYSNKPLEVVMKCLKFLMTSDDNETKKHFFAQMKTLDLSIQIELLREISSLNCMAKFHSDDCQGDVTAACNKISSNSIVENLLKDLIVLVIQSPVKVICQLLEMSISSVENHSVCVEILKNLSCVFKLSTFVKPDNGRNVTESQLFNVCIERLINKTVSDKEWLNLLQFFNILVSNVEEWESSFSRILVKMLEQYVIDKDWIRSKYLLLAVKTFFLKKPVHLNATIMLAFLGQLGLQTSWNAASYDGLKMEVFQICCGFISELGMPPSKEDREWLKAAVATYPDPVRSQFYDVWAPDEHDLNGLALSSLLIIAVRSQCSEERIAKAINFWKTCHTEHAQCQLTLAVFSVLPILFACEWLVLYNYISSFLLDRPVPFSVIPTFKIFSSAMRAFAQCLNTDLFACFEFCMTNLTELFTLLSSSSHETKSSAERILLFQLLLQPLHKLSHTKVVDSCYFVILPALIKYVKFSVEICTDVKASDYFHLVDDKWRDKFRNALTGQPLEGSDNLDFSNGF